MNILVMGSLDTTNAKCTEFLQSFAAELVENGHKLLNGCRNEMDKVLTENMNKLLIEKGLNPHEYITSYVEPGHTPVHDFGTILKSRCTSWGSLASLGLPKPETVQNADVVFVVGGNDGTKCAANWAGICNKPLLPISNFDGAAAEIFALELNDFDKKYGMRIDKSDFEMLNQITTDSARIAQDALALAARIIFSNQVLVIMSYSGDAKLEDAYDSIQTICTENKYTCLRVNEGNQTERIVPEIFKQMSRSAFVIADISEPKPNVFTNWDMHKAYKKMLL
ncbi:MAG: hypothetical protein IPO27_05580 [Bacteroidetes bacterium]|nr:hypothetical protein [Bacteroidota bacterium]